MIRRNSGTLQVALSMVSREKEDLAGAGQGHVPAHLSRGLASAPRKQTALRTPIPAFPLSISPLAPTMLHLSFLACALPHVLFSSSFPSLLHTPLYSPLPLSSFN